MKKIFFLLNGFPYTAIVKTYNSNQQVPDSAGTATAMHTGIKTRAGVIGIGPNAHRGDCGEAQQNILTTFGEIAVSRLKSVGIVTTARLTHATPAAVYAHTPERNWEADKDIPDAERRKGCVDIATQLIQFPFDVALGGGRQNFIGTDKGRRLSSNENLISIWVDQTGGSYVSGLNELISAEKNSPVLGLFSMSHLTYMLDRKAGQNEPTLSQMTKVAIDRLSKKPNGYYLMVEGGRIDHGHHEGKAGYALAETQEFARSVAVAVANTDTKETLILVTADHSHVFTISGYPTRGNPILGLVKGNDQRGNPSGKPTLAVDGKPYTTLGYWNGPGAVMGPRSEPETGEHAKQQAAIPTSSFVSDANLTETHGGEDVVLYASGVGDAGVHGVIEQNKIFDIIMEAFGWQSKHD